MEIAYVQVLLACVGCERAGAPQLRVIPRQDSVFVVAAGSGVVAAASVLVPFCLTDPEPVLSGSPVYARWVMWQGTSRKIQRLVRGIAMIVQEKPLVQAVTSSRES